MVPLNHAYVTGGDDICEALLTVVEGAEALVSEQATAQTDAMHTSLRQHAQVSDRWAEMAPDIDQWTNEDGNPTFGVSDESTRVEQAMRAEYGDQQHAPVPLIRMGLVNGVTQMGWSMEQAFRERGF